ncbi:MAG: hypothetical protein AB8B74_08855 [Crocinitomicaceae bacterium]
MLFSCSKGEPKVEVVSIEDLLGETTTEVEDRIEDKEIPPFDGTFISQLNQDLYEDYKFEPHTYSTLFDRFSYESVEKSRITPMADTNAEVSFFKYSFSDTTSTNNAFDNWLACFGNTCEEIVLKENKNGVNESPLWCGVYETDIFIIKFSTESYHYKNELKQAVFHTAGKPLKYTLNITEDNLLKWD